MAKIKEKEVQLIFTSEKIEEIKEKVDNGYKITRQEKYWAETYTETKRDGIVFTLNEDEQNEYFKCKLGVDLHGLPFFGFDGQKLKMSGIEYFAETYCKVKNELGQVNNIKLRDYQKDILNMFMDNRFSIICGSRQIGKCSSFLTNVKLNDEEVPLFKVLFKYKKKKTIYDYIKYGLYKIIFYLDK